jgi:D-glycero-D-manno-heptose 1,7-bisphosphate phosphatase
MSNKFIILDRDGVINVDLFDYVLEEKTFEFEQGSVNALLKLHKNNFKIIVVTNQTCINLGLISAQGISDINNYWIRQIEELGGSILHTEVCPHERSENCGCRKPDTGLLESAEKKLNINLRGSYFVGDKLSDLECASSYGCKPILVKTGYGGMTLSESLPSETKIFENLEEVVNWIVD